MVEMLAWSSQGLKTTAIHMVGPSQVDSVREQVGDGSRDVELLRKAHREAPETRSAVAEVTNAFRWAWWWPGSG